jgi:hypothetical protein
MHSVSAQKFGIGQPESLPPPQLSQPVRKRGWTDKQWEQSQQYWQKQHQKAVQALSTRRVIAENTFISNIPQARKAELTRLSDMKLVTRPKDTQMPNGISPQPAPQATRRYKDVMSDIGDFLDPKANVQSKFNKGGPQFIQNFTQNSVSVTRRLGVDVEPSAHVQSLSPHLNLQTQHNGVIQGGALQDPHHPIRSFDPFAQGRPSAAAHPLAGLKSDERRAFAERYIHSLGIPIKRE